MRGSRSLYSPLCALLGCALLACALPPGQRGEQDSGKSAPTSSAAVEPQSGSAAPLSLACAPAAQQWPAVQSLYDETEQSVHELITCGGLQVRIATNIVLMLITSNDDLFMAREQAFVQELGRNPFERLPDGRYTMSLPDRPESSFTLTFHDPRDGSAVTADVFDLDSYLQGVHIQTDVGFGEMLADIARKHPFTFTWDAEGPLAHLMNGGRPLPEGFVLQLSLADFLAATPADFGPFASVFDLQVASRIRYFDDRYQTTVQYDVDTSRQALRGIAESQMLAFHVRAISASSGALSLVGDPSELRFVHLGELAGRIGYAFDGELAQEELSLAVTSDFGEGASYPEAAWSCP